MATAKARYHHGDLRSALIEAALEIILDTGPQGLSIREVARRAGVSHAAPYRHFTDKNDLVVAVVEKGFSLMQDTMLEKKAAAEPDAISQFAASGFAYVEFALTYPGYYRVMFSGNLISSDGNVSLQHTSSDALSEMVNDIQAAQNIGIVRQGDATAQAVAIWSTMHGFVSLMNDNRISHLVGKGFTADEIRDLVLAAIFEGIGIPEQNPALTIMETPE